MLVGDAPAFVVNRVLTRMTSVLMDALEHGNTVEETDEAMLRLGLPMAPSVLLQMVGPRVANHVLVTLHESYPDRYPLSPTLANYAEGKDEIVVVEERRRTVEQITQDVLEAVADEIRHLLDGGRRRRPRRRRRLPDPRRRLALLPRRHHAVSCATRALWTQVSRQPSDRLCSDKSLGFLRAHLCGEAAAAGLRCAHARGHRRLDPSVHCDG